MHFLARCWDERVPNILFYQKAHESSIADFLELRESIAESLMTDGAIRAALSFCNIEYGSPKFLKLTETNQLTEFLKSPITYKCIRIWASNEKIFYHILYNDNLELEKSKQKNTCSVMCSRENVQNGCRIHTDMRPARIRCLIAEKVKEILDIPEITTLTDDQLTDFRRAILQSYILNQYEPLDATCNLTVNQKDRVAVRLLTTNVTYPLCLNFGKTKNGKLCTGYSELENRFLCSECNAPGHHVGLVYQVNELNNFTFKIFHKEKTHDNSDINEFISYLANNLQIARYWSVSSRGKAVQEKAALLVSIFRIYF